MFDLELEWVMGSRGQEAGGRGQGAGGRGQGAGGREKGPSPSPLFLFDHYLPLDTNSFLSSAFPAIKIKDSCKNFHPEQTEHLLT